MNEQSQAASSVISTEWGTYRRLLYYAKPYLRRLILGVIFGVLCGGSTFGLLSSIKVGLDHTTGDGGAATDWMMQRMEGVVDPAQSSLAATVLLLMLLPTFAALRGLGFYLSKYYVQWVGHRVVMDLRNNINAHILDLPMLALGRSRTGELISRTTNDTQQVETGVSTVLGDLAREPFVLLAAIGMLVYLDLRLAAISLVLFPICIVPVAIFGRKVRKSARESQANLGDLAAMQQETIVGSAIVKAFGREADEKERFHEKCMAVFRRQVRVTRARAAVTPIVEFISVLAACALLVYARWAGLSLSDLLLFLGSMIVMYDPVKKLSRLHLGVQQTSAAADRIFEVLDHDVAIREQANAVVFNEPVREIEIDHVSFRYADDWVLRDVSLRVPAGEVIALVGSSGAGKTTLVNLLPRFFDVTEGAVLLNGMDVRTLTIPSLRAQFGIVTQETFLFNRSIFENIAYGRPDATRQEVEDAARRAHAHDFILDQPEGYETVIGERGARLSGGQRQRLAIARALLSNPPILILDEATSALDTESERHVQAALDELMTGRTVFAIAHRLSTIQHANRIVVMKDGCIVEIGTHAELLEQGGAYKYFYDLQFAPTA